MKNKGVLPIPFLILILAGVVSLFSILAGRGAKASMVKDDSLQMQTVEQERIAEFYFRTLSWLSDVIPQGSGTCESYLPSRAPAADRKIHAAARPPMQN